MKYVSGFLDSAERIGELYKLTANAGKSHMGTNLVGIGFVLSPEEAQNLISMDVSNSQVLFPFLNGKDLNSDP